ncbi:hypothetical protein SCHPADRAFT_1003440 [Schizopora paradoxa]|uniref:Uncharacterized protein n=1 Tax=Schizopora paradoxa TaxID=27342 RepID=A0A0H2R3D7_9AGAM|nr:hypothetical protein SCHPADRAFT_1003440 [Schizopora paradoxa]
MDLEVWLTQTFYFIFTTLIASANAAFTIVITFSIHVSLSPRSRYALPSGECDTARATIDLILGMWFSSAQRKT